MFYFYLPSIHCWRLRFDFPAQDRCDLFLDSAMCEGFTMDFLIKKNDWQRNGESPWKNNFSVLFVVCYLRIRGRWKGYQRDVIICCNQSLHHSGDGLTMAQWPLTPVLIAPSVAEPAQEVSDTARLLFTLIQRCVWLLQEIFEYLHKFIYLQAEFFLPAEIPLIGYCIAKNITQNTVVNIFLFLRKKTCYNVISKKSSTRARTWVKIRVFTFYSDTG